MNILSNKWNNKNIINALGFAFLLSFVSCSSDDDNTKVKDLEKPVIENEETSVPLNCDVFHKGDVIPFRYTMTDNEELGNYNIEIHHNFDHHTHSTEIGTCPLDMIKKPVHAWVYSKSFPIPKSQNLYKASEDITIPDSIDTGDYHFMIRLTDKTGWQQIKGLSIKILDKE